MDATDEAEQKKKGKPEERTLDRKVVPSPSAETFSREDLVATIRQVFSVGRELDRESAIREVANTLGFNRLGLRIHEEIEGALLAAVKRGAIENNHGTLSIHCRSISDYRGKFLIDVLLSAMGRKWWERKEAIQAGARYLGFRRTGSAIQKAFKSAINGAIRRRLLERDGPRIRKAR